MTMLVLNSGAMPILSHITQTTRILESPVSKYTYKNKNKNKNKHKHNKQKAGTKAMRSGLEEDACMMDTSTLTPSLSSVLHQIKQTNRERRNTGSTLGSSSVSVLSLREYESSSDGALSDILGQKEIEGPELGLDPFCIDDEADDDGFPECNHPLRDSRSSSVSTSRSKNRGRSRSTSTSRSRSTDTLCAPSPHTKIYNLGDLDLTDTLSTEDIVQPIKPIYERPKCKRMSVCSVIQDGSSDGKRPRRNSRFAPIFLENEVVEMEHWPNTTQQQQQQDLGVQDGMVEPDMTLKRTRQQSLNPSFLRLYALETSMKQKNLLPDLNLDESILQKLSIQDIAHLNVPSDPSNKITPQQIKLALITRKKLWTDMCRITRTDLHGEYTPSNLRFVRDTRAPETNDQPAEATSLVRMNSEVKPWSQPEMSKPTMFKPCGRIPLGRNVNSKDIQYVVKGWCDYRFA